MSSITYRSDIDGLRAIAVLSVVIFHLFPALIPGGFVGVDIFFVISGFLITGILNQNIKEDDFTFLGFYTRRIRRIYPSMLSVLFFSIITGALIMTPGEYEKLGKHIFGAVLFIANVFYYFEAGYFDTESIMKPLLHLWSLGVEEQFYLIWPLILFLLIKNTRKVFLSIVILALISFFFNILYISLDRDKVFYLPFFRFWELLSGSILYFAPDKLKSLSDSRYSKFFSHRIFKVFESNFNLSSSFSILGILLILYSFFSIKESDNFPGYLALMPVIGSVLIIGSGEQAFFNKYLLSNRLLVYIGLISYPLYLWHWTIFSFSRLLIKNAPYFFDHILIFFISIGMAALSYRYLEKPIRKTKNLFQVSIILIILSVILGFFGFFIYKLEGLPIRFVNKYSTLPPELKPLVNPNFSSGLSSEWREHICFLAKNENFEKFQDECIAHSNGLKIVLWGDSHAAALYPGLKYFANTRVWSVSQLTASACPPLLDWNGGINKLCKEINMEIFSKISKISPDVLILEAAWYWDEYDYRKLGDTIITLKKLGLKKIIILGASPVWERRVPANILSYHDKYGSIPNQYSYYGVDKTEMNKIHKIDLFLSGLASFHNVDFLSIKDNLCNASGCLLYVGEDVSNVTSLDHGHLSTRAAIIIVDRISKLFSFK